MNVEFFHPFSKSVLNTYYVRNHQDYTNLYLYKERHSPFVQVTHNLVGVGEHIHYHIKYLNT